jgi:hypothetical protein
LWEAIRDFAPVPEPLDCGQPLPAPKLETA